MDDIKKAQFFENIVKAIPFPITVLDLQDQVMWTNGWESESGDVNETHVYEQPLKDGDQIIGKLKLHLSMEKIESIMKRYTDLEVDLKALFEASFDVIYVSDGDGVCLRGSAACESLFGFKAEKLIGRTCYDLEKDGVFRPSITRMVLERKEKVQAVQTTKTGRRLLVVGTPIKDEQDRIIRVVNISRDITEESRYKIELEDTKSLMEGYKRELEQLRKWKQKEPFVYSSEKMKNVLTLASKLSKVDTTVLISGESGVGKEVLADYIHKHSHRSDKPFIRINCGAIPEPLLESELFGYERGAFTGASKDGKPGLFELANGGTLFLDEIGEMPLQLQVKLLRFLQDHEVVRVGGTKPIQTDVRILAATNRNLQEEVKAGRFREDLYYRLNVVPIFIPSLRERREDILPLTLYFLEELGRKYHRPKTMDKDALELLLAYHWPGNVRELQNMIERVVVVTDHPHVSVEDLPPTLKPYHQDRSLIEISGIMPLKDAVDILEKKLLHMAQKKYGSTTKIAEALGVNQSTISRKLSKIGYAN